MCYITVTDPSTLAYVHCQVSMAGVHKEHQPSAGCNVDRAMPELRKLLSANSSAAEASSCYAMPVS